VNEVVPESGKVCGVSESFMRIHHNRLTVTLSQTEDVIFPDRGHRKSTPRKDNSRRLSSPVIALMCAGGLALISLIVSYVRGRKTNAPHVVHSASGTFKNSDEEKGHGYDRVDQLHQGGRQCGSAPAHV
jgi:hypothetical protein